MIDYITISTTGNAIDFGDLISASYGNRGMSSPIRGVWAGAGSTNIIQYVTIATLGNTQDFGDLTVARGYGGATSNAHGGL